MGGYYFEGEVVSHSFYFSHLFFSPSFLFFLVSVPCSLLLVREGYVLIQIIQASIHPILDEFISCYDAIPAWIPAFIIHIQ